MSMICKKCGSEVGAGDKFCGVCGKTIPVDMHQEDDNPMACSDCGAVFEEGTTFCGSCGHKIASTQETGEAQRGSTSVNKFPMGSIVLVFALSCTIWFISFISFRLWLFALIPAGIVVGICAGLYMHKKKVRSSQRAFHSFGVLFFAAFMGFLIPPCLFSIFELFISSGDYYSISLLNYFVETGDPDVFATFDTDLDFFRTPF